MLWVGLMVRSGMQSNDMPNEAIAWEAFCAHLIATNRITPVSLERASRLSQENTERLGIILTRLGLVSERELTEAFVDFLKLPLASTRDFPDAPILEERLARKFLKEARIIPLAEHAEELVVAMVDPLDDEATKALRFATGKQVTVRIAYPADFEAAWERLYGEGKSEITQIFEGAEAHRDDSVSDDVERLKDIASEAPVIRLVNLLIARAVEARASDIHIEPMDGELRIRYRVDGVLQEVESPPQRLSSAVISRIKIMAKLNIAERRLAQDGRFRLAVRGKDIDFRISTTPTIHGESVVLRILDRGSLKLDFAALGFDEDIIAAFRDVLNHPHGILLVTGPTGSGKTTTLYASLLELNTPDKKILTIEDPVEYQLKGINQVQVKPQIGLTFANALRSFLRQDPDIMMIGEIRDLETAQIAVQAALTGHLILSTLHTNDAASAITRLLDMGVEDYLLTSTINGLAAQRLVRTLCIHCREPYEALPEIVERMQLGSLTQERPIILHRPVGCAHCSGTGYLGRSSILEVLIMSDKIRQLVLKRTEAGLIRKAAIEDGMQTMHLHGMKKALASITSIEEVLRVTREV
jgi:general secretion pathway protein E